MAFALELALDDATSRIVRGVWQDLAEAGFPSMARSGARPHVSLGVWEDVDRPAFERALAALAAETPPLDVIVGRAAAFETTGVVYLGLEPTPALTVLHAESHARFARAGRGPSAHYTPGVWVPHCTVALDLTPADLPVALGVAERTRLPLRARLERAGLVEFRPVRLLAEAPLGTPTTP